MSLLRLPFGGTVAFALLCALLLAATMVEARISLPSVISSNMVLQRDSGTVVWGKSDMIGGTIWLTLTVHRQASQADSTPRQVTLGQAGTIGADGSFSFALAPQPITLDASLSLSDADSTVTLSHVAFGDVFLCAGQVSWTRTQQRARASCAEQSNHSSSPTGAHGANRTARLHATLCLILLLRCTCLLSQKTESNMEFSVSAANNASAEIAASINYP